MLCALRVNFKDGTSLPLAPTPPAITAPLLAPQVFLWNMDKYTLIQKLEGHHNDVVSCDFSPDGALLVTASYDTRVIVWDHQKGSVLLELGYDPPPPTASPLAYRNRAYSPLSSPPPLVTSSLLRLPFLPEEPTTAGSGRSASAPMAATSPASPMTGELRVNPGAQLRSEVF